MSVPFFLFSLAFVPFTGTLVRYRLAYRPREACIASPVDELGRPIGSGREEKSCVEGKTIVVPVPSFFNIATTVYQREGCAGFQKGFLPTFLANVVLPIFTNAGGLPRLYMSPSPVALNRPLQDSLLNTLMYSLALVWTYRAITTRAKTGIFGTSINDAFLSLFTPYERERPWSVWSSGLLTALLINISVHFLILRPVKIYIEPKQPMDQEFFVRLAATSLVILASTIIFAPLDVIVTRLTAERHISAAYDTPSSPSSPSTPCIDDMGFLDIEKCILWSLKAELEVEELSVRLRGDHDPYTGVYDCAEKIIREEGWHVLYRGWWVTFIGNIFCS